MAQFPDALGYATSLVQAIPDATDEDIDRARRLLIRHDAFDILEMLGLND